MRLILFLEDHKFKKGKDSDWPERGLVLVFTDHESYKVRGNTHGEQSHAIKHLYDMDPTFMHSMMAEIKEVIGKIPSEDLYLLQGISKIVSHGEEVRSKLKDSYLIDMLDFINDKEMMKDSLNDHEKKFIPIMEKISKRYHAIVDAKLSKTMDVDKMGYDELIKNKNKAMIASYILQGNSKIYVAFSIPENWICFLSGSKVVKSFFITEKGVKTYLHGKEFNYINNDMERFLSH